MKRLLVLGLFLSGLMATTVIATSLVRAQDAVPMTEAHIERIRSNCIEAQASLNQLHVSDALLRVNRGQVYESISTKLMAPLNSRIALNRLDSGNLPAIASQYERTLTTFRTRYQQYDESMSETLKISCKNQPVAFYDSVSATRDKRKLVHDSTVELGQLIQAYRDEFSVFVRKFLETKR